MHVRITLTALALMGALVGVAGCDSPEDPKTTGEEFEITVMAMPASSVRTDATDPHWHAAGIVTLRSDLRLLPGVKEIDVGDGQSYGYDVGVHVARPDHVYMWDSSMGPSGMWMKMEPTGSHYLIVKLGSSAATGNKPKQAVEFTAVPVNGPTADEDEAAEEAFGGWRFVPTSAVVDVSIAPNAGAVSGEETEWTNVAIPLVETGTGFRYAANLGRTGTGFGITAGVVDGLYDITVRIFMPQLTRMEDAETSWNAATPAVPITIVFTGVQITSGTTPDINGYVTRALADVAATRYTVVQGLAGDPLADHDNNTVPDGAHTHNLYIKNARSDSATSPTVANGTETLVVELTVKKPQNVFTAGGTRTGPATGDDLFIDVKVMDPKVPFDHHKPGFYRLPNANAMVTIVHAVTGAKLEVPGSAFMATYSHDHGFHYGTFFTPPWNSGVAGGGGGHGH